MIHSQSVAAPAGMRVGRRAIRRCLVCAHLRELAADWMARRRLRRELLAFIATDHRAASDMRLADEDAVAWATKPFWRG
jgi:hypothetical protein